MENPYPNFIPALESIGDELSRTTSVPDDGSEDISSMMENLALSAQLGVPYFEPIEAPVPYAGLQKVAPPEPEAPWTPSVVLTPAEGSPLGKRARNDWSKGDAREGVKNWMRDQIQNFGKTADQLAEMFSGQDPAYSALIKEIGAEL